MGPAEGNGRTEAESSPALGSMARLAAGASRPTGLGRKRLLRAESGNWLKTDSRTLGSAHEGLDELGRSLDAGFAGCLSGEGAGAGAKPCVRE